MENGVLAKAVELPIRTETSSNMNMSVVRTSVQLTRSTS